MCVEKGLMLRRYPDGLSRPVRHPVGGLRLSCVRSRFAVILARRQIELTEDEKREASGLPRIGHHDDPKSGEVTHG